MALAESGMARTPEPEVSPMRRLLPMIALIPAGIAGIGTVAFAHGREHLVTETRCGTER
jgi:hypothetical protein